MFNRVTALSLFLFSTLAAAQTGKNSMLHATLQAPTTLPIIFTSNISARDSHVGDSFTAKTSQAVHLSDGTVIPPGSKISGHVVAANRFVYDDTPYAKQKESALSIKFDSVQIRGTSVPLNVKIRAAADRLTSDGARIPTMPHDADPWGTMTQIGGDQLTPVDRKVTNSDGDVVAYNKKSGVYAHLIANGSCDSSSVEVSVGIYSASACGLYGFTSVRATEIGSPETPSTLTLVSTHLSPKIWKYSTALLEVISGEQQQASVLH